MRREVEAVIWDLDGTLVDSLPASIAAYAETAASLIGRDASKETIIQALRLGPPAAILGELLGRRCEPSDLENFHEHLSSLVKKVQPFPGIAAALSALKERLHLAVFSGTDRASVEMLLDRSGLSEFFEAVVTGDDVNEVKPHPEGILVACDDLGLPPSKVAYVGDAPADLEAARRAGVTGILAVWGSLPAQEIQSDAIAKTPGDVVRLFS